MKVMVVLGIQCPFHGATLIFQNTITEKKNMNSEIPKILIMELMFNLSLYNHGAKWT